MTTSGPAINRDVSLFPTYNFFSGPLRCLLLRMKGPNSKREGSSAGELAKYLKKTVQSCISICRGKPLHRPTTRCYTLHPHKIRLFASNDAADTSTTVGRHRTMYQIPTVMLSRDLLHISRPPGCCQRECMAVGIVRFRTWDMQRNATLGILPRLTTVNSRTFVRIFAQTFLRISCVNRRET